MKTTIRTALLSAGILGGMALVTPALADETTTTVDPVTGGSVTVHEKDALLPKNRDTEVIVTPGVQPAPDVDIVDSDNGVIHHHEETTIERY
ncbi:hypothetical protein A7A08_01551 [Methyloligella halotolerans]|uniref:Uncharacterized protein n=1 Tax=Methyloligella halotolerans TaxID=1177755 RepID=A0A1E2RZJ1_9HYPH|nr:hypothetical protein [Methyloligella halotolerans]ODA67518.1 hypothetical protein A7A08_01551 [Methyloligella halotolerans]